MNPTDPYNIRERLVNGEANLAEQIKEAKGKVYHFRGMHIYCNFDFSNLYNPEQRFQTKSMYKDISSSTIKENHRVHLFYHRVQPCVEDGSLREFIIKAAEVTGKPVIMHVPKHEYDVQIPIFMATAELRKKCQVIVEKQVHVTVFRHNYYGDEQFLCVGWGAPGGKIFSEFSTPKGDM